MIIDLFFNAPKRLPVLLTLLISYSSLASDSDYEAGDDTQMQQSEEISKSAGSDDLPDQALLEFLGEWESGDGEFHDPLYWESLFSEYCFDETDCTSEDEGNNE